MKFRTIAFFVVIAVLLSACNFTLAEDVTPPPGYVQPTPAPTLGPVYPAQAPDLQAGAVIYAEKCAPCHGDTGMGDGPQAAQLPVPVAALGQASVAAQASPADWYQVVTRGNMDNFMPPFSSLSDQERWDVVAYAQSLSSTSEQISQGEQLFNKNCTDCPTDPFSSQEMMAALSTNDLVSMLSEGGQGLPALGGTLSKDELNAVAAYLRTLSVDASSLASEPASAQTASPSAEGTPAASGEQAGAASEASTISGSVSGKLINASGGDLPAGATVILHGFDHGSTTNANPEEVVNETTTADANGKFAFENVDLTEGRIFLVEASYKGISFQSDLVISDAGATELTVPDVNVYESTTDSSDLVVEQLHISFDMAVEGNVQVFELFTISNQSDKAYVFTTDGTSLPFMPLPENAADVGLELSQDSAPLMPTESGALAIPPNDNFYSIIAFFSMPYDKSLEINQPLVLPVNSALVIVPEGIDVESSQLVNEGVQQTDQGANVDMYSGTALKAGSSIQMTLSGKVKSTGTGAVSDNRALLIGAGAFGVVLILAGVWLFLRDRNKEEEEEFEDEDEEEFETAEEVMDAIIALDDLHRAKKIPDEAYQERRAELKEKLKELS